MVSSIHIVASCADRKRVAPLPSSRLRAHRARRVEERCDRWWSAISSASSERMPAEELYAGPYWATARSIPDAAGRRKANLWVASAGYGLVPAKAPLTGYSATFASNQADSVARPGDPSDMRVAWWSALSGYPGPALGAPRSVTELVGANPQAAIVVLGSPSYVDALGHDLSAARAELGRSGRLVIITGEPGPAQRELQPYWVPSSASLLYQVGGALPALHARVARRIVEDAATHEFDADVLQEHWRRVADGSPTIMKPSRTPTTDEEVKNFIRTALTKDPKAKHSRLLRDYREAGSACEQSRFRRLFLEVTGAESK